MPYSMQFFMRYAWLIVTAMVCVAATSASATQAAFDFVSYGNFKHMVQTGDTTGQVKLAELPHGAGTWGIGALAGLTGEVVLVDGRLLISRGEHEHGSTSARRPEDEAVLFAAARVQQWTSVALPSDMTQAHFEAFVVEQARSHGLDTHQPFPFRVEGPFQDLTWHVVNGHRAPAGHAGHGNHAGQSRHNLADMRVFKQVDASGTLVAMYSAARYAGIITHPGQYFHAHFIDPAQQSSGHVDAYRLRKGAVLQLPVK